MSKVEINGRIVGLDALQQGAGYSTTLHVDALTMPRDLPDHYGSRNVTITFDETPGEIACEAYRAQSARDGHSVNGYGSFEDMPAHTKERWEAAARAVLAKAAR